MPEERSCSGGRREQANPQDDPMILHNHDLITLLPNWEKNRNFFDFLRHGEEIWFSNFRLRHFGKVAAIWGQNGTLDEIDKVSTSDNSTPSGEN